MNNLVLGAIAGLAVGIFIDRSERRKRDAKITELENELKVSRNVIKSLNGDNVKLRKRIGNDKKSKRIGLFGEQEG